MGARSFEIRGNLESEYPDVFTPEALDALEVLSKFDADRKALLAARTANPALTSMPVAKCRAVLLSSTTKISFA